MSRGLVCEFIAAKKTTYGVRRLCRVFGISPTTFYTWAKRAKRAGGPTEAELGEAYAIHAARAAWIEHRRVYGAHRLTAEVRDRGHAWNGKRVARLMRLGAIEGAHRRRRGKFGWRTASTTTAPDRVERKFTATAPNQLCVADISYLRSWEGFVYLAVVVDAFSRKVVGWAMVESFFATLKEELIYRRSWPTRHELEMEVFSYIEGFYNTRRRHSRLENLSPTDYERMHLTQNEVSA